MKNLRSKRQRLEVKTRPQSFLAFCPYLQLLSYVPVALNPSSVSNVMVRAPNWLGDAVMSLPALRAVRQIFSQARLTVVARPSVTDLYARESAVDDVIPYNARGLAARRAMAAALRARRFDCAILLQNAFDAALLSWMARIPERIGYSRDGRGWLLTGAVKVPEPGEVPRHERFYYLELLRRAGLLEHFPDTAAIRLDGIAGAREAGLRRLAEWGITGPATGISPGAAYGGAKRWLPERFAETARKLRGAVLVFGSAAERNLCARVAADTGGRNLAGETSLREFIDLAAACRLFLTNDSGAMHVAAALGIPTVAVFGATDDTTTGPTGPTARVVRAHAECSPCLLRECPIDHRCMTRVSSDMVAEAALQLREECVPVWTQEAKS
jgi:heptosyltransferase-2